MPKIAEYDPDILSWSKHQAALLQRVANGEVVNEPPDWTNLIEEILFVEQSQADTVESWLFHALVHLLKAEAWPLADAVLQWQAEARGFRAQARRRYRASMAQRIDLPGLYADALIALPDTMDGVPPLPVPTECPVTLDEVLAS
jgi:Domain of unknown function DUF29